MSSDLVGKKVEGSCPECGSPALLRTAEDGELACPDCSFGPGDGGGAAASRRSADPADYEPRQIVGDWYWDETVVKNWYWWVVIVLCFVVPPVGLVGMIFYTSLSINSHQSLEAAGRFDTDDDDDPPVTSSG